MDPRSPNYDRPPAGFNRSRRRRNKPQTVTGPRPQVMDGNRPPYRGPVNYQTTGLPPRTPSGAGPMPQPKPGSSRRQAIARLSGGNVPFKDPRKGGFPTKYPQGYTGKKTNAEGEKIGFYNATHKHGEPMKGYDALLSKLKKRRKSSGAMKSTFTPNVTATPRSRR